MDILFATLLGFSGLPVLAEYSQSNISLRTKAASSSFFLEIWDLSASNSKGATTSPSAVPLVVASGDNLATAFDRLPQQAPDTVRIYIEEIGGDALAKLNFGPGISVGVCNISLRLQALLGPKKSCVGLLTIISQWSTVSPKQWYELTGWSFLETINPANAKRSIPWPLHEEAADLKIELKELAGRPHQEWVSTVRRLRLEGGDELIRAYISCETGPYTKRFRPYVSAVEFRTELLGLENTYQPLRTKTNMKQLFLLQHQHANLMLFTKFIQQVSSEYAVRRRKDIDPRQSTLRQWNLRAIMTDVDLYRQFSSVNAELQSVIELLSDVVLALAEHSGINDPQIKAKLSVLRVELNCCCKDITNRLERLSTDLDQDLKFLNMSRDMSQSGNVQTLTLLATIFLPLSLSAGVLSMQSRFHELGVRLYDFFGIVVLLVAIVLTLLHWISMYRMGMELVGRLQKRRWYRLYTRPAFIVASKPFFMTTGLVVLVSFLVGMFKDVSLGARILGWGLLAIFLMPIAIAMLLLMGNGLVQCWKHLTGCVWWAPGMSNASKMKSRKEKQTDPEQSLRLNHDQENTRIGILGAAANAEAPAPQPLQT